MFRGGRSINRIANHIGNWSKHMSLRLFRDLYNTFRGKMIGLTETEIGVQRRCRGAAKRDG